MNEMQALRSFVLIVGATAGVLSGGAWAMLFFLRKKVRHDRQLRQERESAAREIVEVAHP